jgi:hypothetical protein
MKVLLASKSSFAKVYGLSSSCVRNDSSYTAMSRKTS